MYAGLGEDADLRRLAHGQGGVATRRQLQALGVSPHRISNQLAAERWQAIGPTVLLHNAEPTRRQLMWIAALDAGPLAGVGSHTSLELAGFTSWAREASAIHLVVPRGTKPTPLPSVVVHESRRLADEHLTTDQGVPRTGSARSCLDAAAWQPWPRFACALLAAVVQQRVCGVAELERAMGMVGRIRHKQYLRLALLDIRGGAQALSEIDLVRLCRRHGLVLPTRQRRRRDAGGRLRYLDAEWELPNGEVVVLEVDGRHHLDVEHWQADMRRERGIVISRRWVLRATAMEVRLEPGLVAGDLRAMGVPAPTCQNLSRL